jgi:uncharacterized protein (DUF169 family)
MDMGLKERFAARWKKYFGSNELPIVFYYSDEVKGVSPVTRPTGHRCIMGDIAKIRRGESLYFQTETVGCYGGRRYLGFSDEVMPNFEYFLSCGIEGELEGERYKKTPEIVREMMQTVPMPKAPARFIVFKRWDRLQEQDEPEVVVFFAHADVLSGLFTLANFDEVEPNAVFSPFAAGCGSITQYPYLEKGSDRPRAVLGMFDVSSRPFVRKNLLTLAVPMCKFVKMVENMDESFLITESWKKVKKRIK